MKLRRIRGWWEQGFLKPVRGQETRMFWATGMTVATALRREGICMFWILKGRQHDSCRVNRLRNTGSGLVI